jgi:hypothetical protein
VPSPLLVHGPSGDLLGAVRGGAALARRLLDVLVLAGTLGALLHTAWWHHATSFSLRSAWTYPALATRNEGCVCGDPPPGNHLLRRASERRSDMYIGGGMLALIIIVILLIWLL